MIVGWEELIHDMVVTHRRKQQDYGNSKDQYGNINSMAALLRCDPLDICRFYAAGKVARIRNLENFHTSKAPEFEPLVDSYMDLAVYSTIAVHLVILEEPELMWREIGSYDDQDGTQRQLAANVASNVSKTTGAELTYCEAITMGVFWGEAANDFCLSEIDRAFDCSWAPDKAVHGAHSIRSKRIVFLHATAYKIYKEQLDAQAGI